MSGAQSWSVEGIDPKVQEAAREAAERQGVSLGEYLNQALSNQGAPSPEAPPSDPRARARARRPEAEEEDEQERHGGAVPVGGSQHRHRPRRGLSQGLRHRYH